MEDKMLSRHGMVEAYTSGVEHLAVRKFFQKRIALAHTAAVQGVAPDRVSHLAQMHPNLVGAAGEDAHRQHGEVPAGVGIQGPVDGQGRLAAPGGHGHFGLVAGVPSDGKVDGSLGPFRTTAHNGHVLLVHLAGREILGQFQTASLVQGHQKQAGGVLVQAMHNPGPEGVHGGHLRKPAHQPVGQSPVGLPRRGMHHQPGGLVQHQQVGVPVRHLQRALLGLHAGSGRLSGQGYCFAARQPGVGAHADRTIHHGVPGLDPLLDQFARQSLPRVPHRSVQPRIKPRSLALGRDLESPSLFRHLFDYRLDPPSPGRVVYPTTYRVAVHRASLAEKYLEGPLKKNCRKPEP